MNKHLNILLISSMPIQHSANLGHDITQAMLNEGHSVDFLTRYNFEGRDTNMYSVFEEFMPPPKKLFITKLKGLIPILSKIHKPKYLAKRASDRNFIRNFDESTSPVSINLIIKKLESINSKYDLVITLFWEYMLTTKTLEAIYNNLKCPIFIWAVDMFPITGGCFYFRNCKQFMESCKQCPLIPSKKEKKLIHNNFEIKRNVYQNIDYRIFGNTWMCNHFNKSPLLNKNKIQRGILPINEKSFSNQTLEQSRKQLGLSGDHFIMFAGAQGIKYATKGFNYLVAAVNTFFRNITDKEKQNIIILIAGNDTDADIQRFFDCRVIPLGFVASDKLPVVYSASDVFLSSSIEDAGPTMVNQALMTGTPVVAFEVGVALDIVINDQTGYIAEYKNHTDFAFGINEIYNKNKDERKKMMQCCRTIAMENYSLKAFAHSIAKAYDNHQVKKQ